MPDNSAIYFTIYVLNSSTVFLDSQVYVLGFGLAPGATNQSWIQFNTSTGEGTLVGATVGEASAPYTVQLNTLPMNADKTAYVLKIPQTVSGRIHLSINNGLCLTVNTGATGAITINDPNPYDPQDPNYFTIWDKFELTFNRSGSPPININTTAVDFFGLPLSLQLGGQGPVGLTESRSAVLSTLSSQLTGPWANLILNYGSGSDAAVLRVMCPQEAIGILSQQGFPTGYLDSYIDAVWTYYQTASLGINVGSTLFTGTVDVNNNFNFKSPGETTVTVQLPASNDVFGCDGNTLTANSSDPTQAAIVTVLGAALNLGLLPLPPSISALSSAPWTPSNMPTYYTNNPQLPALSNSGPWYNVYAAAIHNNGANNQGFMVYAFPYDDLAGQSSLLGTTDLSTTATLTINDCTGTTPPNLMASTVWTVVFQVGAQASGSVVNNAGKTFTLAGATSVSVPGLSSGFTMTYNTTGTNVTYTVYIVTTPQLNTVMSACPADLAIVVDGTSGSTITVALPGGTS
jgi:hypothetical protein